MTTTRPVPNFADLETVAALAADIPFDLARRAHAHTSHVPDERGIQEQTAYADTLTQDYAHTRQLCGGDAAKLALLDAEFSRYREGYRRRYVARLEAHSRCASTMITGRSNFNVRRAEKANAVEEKRPQPEHDRDRQADRGGAVVSRRKRSKRSPDVTVADHGSIALLYEKTDRGRDWCEENLPDVIRFGGGIACEPRYVGAILEALVQDGLAVGVES